MAYASTRTRKHIDPYAQAQAKQRKLANQAKQEEIRKRREVALGDPIRGVNTPFLESLDTVGGSSIILGTEVPAQSSTSSAEGVPSLTISTPPSNVLLNHYLKTDELQQSIRSSYHLTAPLEAKDRDTADPAVEQEAKANHDEAHARATLSLARIVSLANASQSDRTRANVQRCVETFGRHNTDKLNPDAESDIKTPRAGPDTGSSEVQIAILTAKIRALAAQLAAHGGNRDKANKRNLKLLVHRRQRLLKYLRRKERGNERWQRLVETLGLTDGTWVGEITNL